MNWDSDSDKHMKVGRRRAQWKAPFNKVSPVTSSNPISFRFPVKRSRPDYGGWSVRRMTEKKTRMRLGRKTWSQVDALNAQAQAWEDSLDIPDEDASPLADYDAMLMDTWYDNDGWLGEDDFPAHDSEADASPHGLPPVSDTLAKKLLTAMQCPGEKCLKLAFEKEDGHLSADTSTRVLAPAEKKPHTLDDENAFLKKSLEDLTRAYKKLEDELVSTKMSKHLMWPVPTWPVPSPRTDQALAPTFTLGDLIMRATTCSIPPFALGTIWPCAMPRSFARVPGPYSPKIRLFPHIGSFLQPRQLPRQFQLCVFDKSKFALVKWNSAQELVRRGSCSSPVHAPPTTKACARHPTRTGLRTPCIKPQKACRRRLGLPNPKKSPWGKDDVVFSRSKPNNNDNAMDFSHIRKHVMANIAALKVAARQQKRRAVAAAKREQAAKLALAEAAASAQASDIEEAADDTTDDASVEDTHVDTDEPVAMPKVRKVRVKKSKSLMPTVKVSSGSASLRARKRAQVAQLAIAFVQKQRSPAVENSDSPTVDILSKSPSHDTAQPSASVRRQGLTARRLQSRSRVQRATKSHPRYGKLARSVKVRRTFAVDSDTEDMSLAAYVGEELHRQREFCSATTPMCFPVTDEDEPQATVEDTHLNSVCDDELSLASGEAISVNSSTESDFDMVIVEMDDLKEEEDENWVFLE